MPTADVWLCGHCALNAPSSRHLQHTCVRSSVDSGAQSAYVGGSTEREICFMPTGNDAPENGDIGRDATSRVPKGGTISQTVDTANVIEWARLNLRDLKTPVLRVTRIRRADRFGILVEEVVLSLVHFPGLTADDAVPDIGALASRYGLSVGKATERVSLVPVPGYVAQYLGIPAGTDVVKLDRITATTDGEPVEWRVAYVWRA